MRRLGKTTHLVLALVLVLMVLSIVPQQAEAAETDRFGYTKLTSNEERKAYELITDAVAAGNDEVSMAGLGINKDHLTKATDMVILDHPEFFYFYGYKNFSSYDGNVVEAVKLRYMLAKKEYSGTSSEIKNARVALDQKINEIVAGMPNGNAYQKALYLHDYIVDNVVYQESVNDQHAYGALMEGRAVCAGYTHAYQLLLRKAGIDSLYITGTSKGVSHAWLLVWINGECYYTDVTWDDPVVESGESLKGHYYFDMSYDDISRDHTADPVYSSWLPKKHDHKEMYYFEKEAKKGSGIGWFNSSTNPDTLYEYLKKNGNQYVCDFRYDGNDINDWLSKACQNIANQIGNTNISCKAIGQEYFLTITAESPEHELRKVDAKSATCTTEGNKAYYVCQKCDTYFEDAEGKKEIANKTSVVISKSSHTAGAWKSDAGKHWKECTASGCGAVISGTSAAHSDQNGDRSCEVCGYKMTESSSTTQTNPPTQATSPSTGATVPSTEATVPSTEVTAPSTEATSPSTEATEDSTPSTEETEETHGDSNPTENTTAPTEGTQNPPSENGDDAGDSTWIVIAGAAVVVIGAAAFVIIRKKRIS